MKPAILWIALAFVWTVAALPVLAKPTKTVVFIAGKKSHGAGEHEYEKGLYLLKDCLETAPNLHDWRGIVYKDGWAADERAFDTADTIVLFCDGSDHNEDDHPLLAGNRLKMLEKAMARGVGLVVLHYTVFVPTERVGAKFIDWVGGYFDYESGTGTPKWYSRIQTAEATPTISATHPIGDGVDRKFPLKEEYYYKMRFGANDGRVTPIMTVNLPNESELQTVAWATQRTDGGRGFAYTGGHFHNNWENPNVRRMILNAIVWTAKGDVPSKGVDSTLSATNSLTKRTGKTVDWANTNRDKGGTRFAPLKQINKANVAGLRPTWVYRTGEKITGNGDTIQCTPIVRDGIMYVTTVKLNIVALDAATGRELWKFNPYPQNDAFGVNRGLAYWSDGKPNGVRRILTGTPDGHLISLDARTGETDDAFGKDGWVDLRAGMDRDLSKMFYGCSAPPMVYKNLVVLGFWVSEGQPGAPGDIRAFDVRTGKQVWIFHTVPRPGEFGNETWAEGSWKERGAANAWNGYTIDEKNGILFAGTGSAASDFYGADRHGSNLFANCVLALNIATGKRLWHFQTVRHDLWDYDNPCPPVLVTVNLQGKKREAVAQVTKTGYCFVLDRKTGEPIFGTEERSVAASEIMGEAASPTQIFPLKPPPFSRIGFTTEDATNISPEARKAVQDKLKTLKHGDQFIPPSREGSVVAPGFHGGANWSGASYDPNSGYLFVNSNNTPWIATMLASSDSKSFNFTGYNYFHDPQGYPAIKPPWGNLTAINLNTGEFAWQVPLGVFPELIKRGIAPTGTENFGGTIVTEGGLVFIAGTMDERFRAFDKDTGKILWEYQLDAGGYATPCTYMVNGKQYVVIAAGGGGKLRTKSGDSFMAFALPD